MTPETLQRLEAMTADQRLARLLELNKEFGTAIPLGINPPKAQPVEKLEEWAWLKEHQLRELGWLKKSQGA